MGSAEPIIRNNIKQNFFGSNGFSDIEVWKPYYPKNINEIIQPKNAIEIIRELVTKVHFLQFYLTFHQFNKRIFVYKFFHTASL